MMERADVLAVSVQHRRGVDLVSVRGVLDLFTAPELRAVLSAAGPCHAPDLVLDLSGLSFLDSIGIGTIVAGRRLSAARGGTMVVVALPGTAPHRILHLLALHQVMEIVPDLPAALQSVGSDPLDRASSGPTLPHRGHTADNGLPGSCVRSRPAR
jgi:anti-anti-sigma factor